MIEWVRTIFRARGFMLCPVCAEQYYRTMWCGVVYSFVSIKLISREEK